MKARALKTFKGRYGLIRQGTVFECEPGYFKALAKNAMVEEAKPHEAAQVIEPEKNRAIPRAPKPEKKDQPPADSRKPPGGTAPRTAAGRATTSHSLRADLASRKKTLIGSGAGEAAKTNPTEPPPPTEPPVA